MIEQKDWTQRARERGLLGAVHLMLDVLEPLGPLGAQLLWVAQPAAGLFGGAKALGEIAEALEAPEGLDTLRQRLYDETGAA